MRVRYVPIRRRLRCLWDDTDGEHEGYEHRAVTMTVHEPRDDEPEDSGLLDHLGNPLGRKVERRPIGFLHRYGE